MNNKLQENRLLMYYITLLGTLHVISFLQVRFSCGFGRSILGTGHRLVAVELRIHHDLVVHDDQDHVHHFHSDFCNISQTRGESKLFYLA